MTISFFIRAVQILAIAIMLFELIFAICQKPSEMQSQIICLAVSCIIMFAGYIIELDATCKETALAGTAFAYIGKPFVMVSSFLFISTFYNRKIPNWATIIMIIYSTAFTVLVFTNEQHHLYYAATHFDIQRVYSPLSIEPGPLYFLWEATVIVYMLACAYVIASNYRRIENKASRPLTIYLVGMLVSAMLGYVVYLAGVTGGYDSTMLGIFFSTLFVFVLFVRYRIFDSLAFAKDQALEGSINGLIVLNQNDEVIYSNSVVEKIVKHGLYIEDLIDIKEENSTRNVRGLTYAIHSCKIMDGTNYLGRSIEIMDVSTSANYQNRLEAEIRDRTDKLEDMQRAIVASVANIVEARSVETGGHIRRTSTYVNIIARSLLRDGFFPDILNDEYIRLLTSVAPLHDIGKISVPDSILLKPGKLTPDEFKLMQVHTSAGAEIIERTMKGLETDEYVALAEEVAKYHHERRDGKGYPNGLFGNEIPLSARIVALADTFDALTSDRCYKDAYTKEEAIDIIKKEKGDHFDPIIVDAFVKAIENIDLDIIDGM